MFERLKKLTSFTLSHDDQEILETLLSSTQNVRGDIFEIERDDPAHKGIMKVNLNDVKPRP